MDTRTGRIVPESQIPQDKREHFIPVGKESMKRLSNKTQKERLNFYKNVLTVAIKRMKKKLNRQLTEQEMHALKMEVFKR